MLHSLIGVSPLPGSPPAPWRSIIIVRPVIARRVAVSPLRHWILAAFARLGVHAVRLISLINVPDDLYIQFSSSTEAVLPVGRRTPSPIRRFEGVKFNPSQKYFLKNVSQAFFISPRTVDIRCIVSSSSGLTSSMEVSLFS